MSSYPDDDDTAPCWCGEVAPDPLADLRRQLQPWPTWYDPHGWMVALMTDRTRAELGRPR